PPAPMHHRHAVAPASELANLTRQASALSSVPEGQAADFDHQSHASAISWGKPYIRFMFSTAWPAAPLPRLSSAETTTRRRVLGSSAKPRSAQLVWATAWITGRPDPSTRTSGAR